MLPLSLSYVLLKDRHARLQQLPAESRVGRRAPLNLYSTLPKQGIGYTGDDISARAFSVASRSDTIQRVTSWLIGLESWRLRGGEGS